MEGIMNNFNKLFKTSKGFKPDFEKNRNESWI